MKSRIVPPDDIKFTLMKTRPEEGLVYVTVYRLNTTSFALWELRVALMVSSFDQSYIEQNVLQIVWGS